MDWTREQYDHIKHLLPKLHGNVEIENITFLRSLQYIAENGLREKIITHRQGV